MSASGLGSINASVEARGSRYATRGELTGRLPNMARQGFDDEIVLSIDGIDVSRTPHRFDASVTNQPGGGERTHTEFLVTIPAQFHGRTLSLGLRVSAGPIGESPLRLHVDDEGNAFLAALNEVQWLMLERAAQLFRDGKVQSARLIYARACCADLYADFQHSLAAARCFAADLDRDAAQIILSQALIPAAQDYSTLTQVGQVLLSLDRYGEAGELFDRAIALDHQSFAARNGKIKAIIGGEDWVLALAEAHRLRQATAAGAPQLADLCGTIAWLYLNISEPERALTEATMALHDFPQNTRLMQMRGDALVRLSRYEEAIAVYRQALASNTKAPLLRKRLAGALMLVGEFGDSADQDVGRMLTPTFAKLNNVPQGVPIWHGEPHLPGKLLIWSEVNFGVGQNLLHASLVPELLDIGLDVVLEVEPRLVPVLKAAMPEVEVVAQVPAGEARGDWMEGVARHIPIGSLARYLRREPADFDAPQPYLRHDRLRAADLRAGLLAQAPRAKFLIGISWTSNNPYVGDEKSVPLADLLASLDLPGAAIVDLQYGEHGGEIASAVAQSGVPVLQCAEIDNTNDLAGLCDLMGALDMVVCIGHTTAHLAGGLGIPNLVMVPSSPFPHWLAAGEQCVWYPNSIVLRQTTAQRGDWSGVLGNVQQRVARQLLAIPESAPAIPAPVPDRLANFCRNGLQLAAYHYHYEAAAALVSVLEQRYPSDPVLREHVGDSQFRLGEFSRAIRSFDAALSAGGDKVRLTRKKAQVLLENYDLPSAEDLLATLFREQPELRTAEPDLVVMHARILANQRHFRKATAALADLLERDPGHADAALTSAHALSQVGEHRQASAILRNALQITPSTQLERALAIEVGHGGLPELAVKALDLTLAREHDAAAVFWRGQFTGPRPGPDRVRIGDLEGTLPQDAAANITVFVCMDTSYCMRYLRSIAGSIADNAPSTNLHVHIVNPHEAAFGLIDAVAAMMAPGRFSCSFERSRLAGLDPDGRKTYYASIRFVRLAEIMQACPGTYYVMDADNLVRGELRSTIALTHSSDLLIRNRFTLQPQLAVAGCGILLSDTDAARDFIARTAGYIMAAFRSGDVAWFLDQIALTVAMNEAPSRPGLELRIRQLPTTLLDWDFLDESLVWTGKGKRRSRNKRYLAEYRHYFDTFGQPLTKAA